MEISFLLLRGIILLIVACSLIETTFAFDDLQSKDIHMENVTRITSDGDNGEAYFSWDSMKLIYQSSRDNYACDKIWIMNIDGSGKRMASPDHGAHTCSFFFPDNERIVFSSTSHLPGNCPLKPEMPEVRGHVWPLYPYDIFIANIDGKGITKITENPEYDAESIVSSDGQHIVFGSKRSGDFNVYIMNADGSNVRRLTDRIGYDGGPWFSPDGKKIVWRAWYPETKDERSMWKKCMENNYVIPLPLDLWIMDSDGSNKKMILRNGATNFAPSWHPDGKRVIFSSNMDDWHEDIKTFGHNFELYLINTDGTGLERITHNKVFDGFPMFSPDGKKIAFASNRNPQKPRATDIFIADWVE
jgi:Tol biopolymer transport system component